jgi:hypothetical protein
MTWKFPKRIPRAGEVVDVHDFNDGIQPFVEEDGRLNEHNWNEDLKTQLTLGDMDEDIAHRVLHKSNLLDASEGSNPSAVTPFEIDGSSVWQPLAMDGTNTSYEFRSRGGVLYIVASLQWSAYKPTIGVVGTPGPPFTYPDGETDNSDYRIQHTLFGIRIDGALEPISVIGDQDSLSEAVNMETGISGLWQGVDIDIAVPVGPGRHTVEVVAKTEVVESEDDRILSLVYSTELLVWEIR